MNEILENLKSIGFYYLNIESINDTSWAVIFHYFKINHNITVTIDTTVTNEVMGGFYYIIKHKTKTSSRFGIPDKLTAYQLALTEIFSEINFGIAKNKAIFALLKY